MGMKTGIILGLGVGYVLGARAGRERYESIRSAASRIRSTPVVARPLDSLGDRVSDAVRSQGEKVTDRVADVVKERLFGTSAGRGEYVDVEIEVEEPRSHPIPR
ncbi:MAG: YtxH domain-containing protein [Actinomyces sp.]|nr:YtxH domain-containing protein [Actinomyces sp.]MDN6566006.1 YtxH domain-containing protein [Actinomyces sp.]MDN6794870.1 YtxH domain-containing protein [Propionibacterium sp.]